MHGSRQRVGVLNHGSINYGAITPTAARASLKEGVRTPLELVRSEVRARHPELGDAMVAEMVAELEGEGAGAGDTRTTKISSSSASTLKTQPAFRAPRGGVDAGDHPPITPAGAGAASPSDVGGVDAWRVYDLVVRRFVAACARDCVVVTHAVPSSRGASTAHAEEQSFPL